MFMAVNHSQWSDVCQECYVNTALQTFMGKFNEVRRGFMIS